MGCTGIEIPFGSRGEGGGRCVVGLKGGWLSQMSLKSRLDLFWVIHKVSPIPTVSGLMAPFVADLTSNFSVWVVSNGPVTGI